MELIDKNQTDEIIDELLGNNDLKASPEVWHRLHQIKNLPVTEIIALQPQSDLVSRQAALDALARTAREKFNLSDEYNHYLAGLMDGELAIKELPTIQPEERTEERTKTHSCDLIDRQAAQTELMMKCERYTLARESHGMGHVEWSSDLISVADAMDAIRDLPPAQTEPLWVPISERMPRDGTWNIFTDGKNISVERYKADAIDHFFQNGRWFQLEDVIAWMPLPEPYQECEQHE